MASVSDPSGAEVSIFPVLPLDALRAVERETWVSEEDEREVLVVQPEVKVNSVLEEELEAAEDVTEGAADDVEVAGEEVA